MGLGASPQELETVLTEIEQEAEAFLSRPLASDWLVLYIDAKVVSLKDEHDQVRKAVHFLVIGLNLEARKEILCSRIFWGNEAIDCWRQVLLTLKNRGLTRVLLVVTDDFPGLEPLLRSLLPGSDHQLCTVHLLRNARRHLSPTDYETFHQTWQDICSCSSFDTARKKWQTLLLFLTPDYSSYAQHLESRTKAYLTFMHYPRAARPNLRTTNLPEGEAFFSFSLSHGKVSITRKSSVLPTNPSPVSSFTTLSCLSPPAFGSAILGHLISSSLEHLKPMLHLLDGIVDIYMPDMKYWEASMAESLSAATDYPQRAREAILEMHHQVGPLYLDSKGLARRGVLVRHLILPGLIQESARIFEWLARDLSPDTYINLMTHYRPAYHVGRKTPTGILFPEINRSLTHGEMTQVQYAARESGLWRFDGQV